MSLNGQGNRETDEEHGKDCVEKGFQLGWVKSDRSDQGEKRGIRVGCCGIIISDEAELELD